MKHVLVILSACLIALVSCTTTPEANPIYQSSAPEERGERAISSAVELVAEVELASSRLGVFFSREIFESGEAQNVLFTVRARTISSTKPSGKITDYDLGETASLSIEQADRFLKAIEEYLAKDLASVQPSEMMSYELYSGTLDMASGTESYRPFKSLTFGAICSVTSAGKRFQTVFPYTYTGLTPSGSTSYTSYHRYELTIPQVQKLRDAIVAALAKSSPIIPVLPAAKPGS